MREIKFRVWDKITKQWPSGFSINPDGVVEMFERDGSTGRMVDPNNFMVMQYTGLKDKAGKEIYEGDILEVDDAVDFLTLEVYWHEPSASFGLTRGGYERDMASGNDCKITGNIYENPELLVPTPIKQKDNHGE